LAWTNAPTGALVVSPVWCSSVEQSCPHARRQIAPWRAGGFAVVTGDAPGSAASEEPPMTDE
jgi:hypothetical protein